MNLQIYAKIKSSRIFCKRCFTVLHNVTCSTMYIYKHTLKCDLLSDPVYNQELIGPRVCRLDVEFVCCCVPSKCKTEKYTFYSYPISMSKGETMFLFNMFNRCIIWCIIIPLSIFPCSICPRDVTSPLWTAILDYSPQTLSNSAMLTCEI